MAVHIGSDHTVINWIDELVGPIRIGNAVNPGARIERSGTGGQSAIDGWIRWNVGSQGIGLTSCEQIGLAEEAHQGCGILIADRLHKRVGISGQCAVRRSIHFSRQRTWLPTQVRLPGLRLRGRHRPMLIASTSKRLPD